MSKTRILITVYLLLLGAFLALPALLLNQNNDSLAQEKRFVHLLTLSDAALYGSIYGVRFYSLVNYEELVDDPVLPLFSKSEFVYRSDANE